MEPHALLWDKCEALRGPCHALRKQTRIRVKAQSRLTRAGRTVGKHRLCQRSAGTNKQRSLSSVPVHTEQIIREIRPNCT
ncbi:hypothetical protein AAFF_G00361200 [Aldrovandia affinis]|uniref:Uncharacterized protein n=1 Tax=Aldrovandia affinis TaxID=143900 RepID=A0AAD7R4Z8_9TELE|nr:hypothetical protein AAFF_G00361200 [Aldrovandia affinis]